MAEAFPLHWPAGWPRTPAHERKDGRSKFSRQDWRTGGYKPISVATARDKMLEELRLLGAEPGLTVISSDVPLRNDGLPRSGWNPDDPGVAVYFVLDGEPMVMARDAFTGVAENLRSLTLAIEALRQLHRHGGGVMLKRAFAGFSALPPPDGTTPASSWTPWWVDLGLNARPDTLAQAKAAWRKAVMKAHPDHGGSGIELAKVNTAWTRAQQDMKG